MPPPTKKTDTSHIEALIESFRSSGFGEIGKPDGLRPMMPENIAALLGSEVSNYQSSYAAWKEYTEDLLTVTNARIMQLQEMYDLEFTKLCLTLPGKTETEKKNRATVADSIQPLGRQLTELLVYAKMLESKIESYAGCLAVISREISARKESR